MIFTFKITRIHSNLWCYGQLTVFSPAGQWRRFTTSRDLDWSSLPPPRCARIENNKCVLWRPIKLCDRETHIHILPTFWGLSPNFTTWYISSFWVDWDRIFPRTRKKSSGEIYVLGVKMFLYTRVLGASVKPTHTNIHTHIQTHTRTVLMLYPLRNKRSVVLLVVCKLIVDMQLLLIKNNLCVMNVRYLSKSPLNLD